MNIIVVEDDKCFREKLISDIQDFFNKLNKQENSIKSYESIPPNQSLNDIDIAFLDIDLINESGIVLAKKIKKENPLCIIIFVSALEELVFQSLIVHPLYFVRKNQYNLDIIKLFIILEDRFKKNTLIFLAIRGIKTQIPVRSIIYVESDKHTLYIETTKGTYCDTRSLTKLHSQLPENAFVRIHKSFIINLEFLSNFKANELTLSNKKQLPIGRIFKENFIEAYKSFLIR